MTTKSDGLIKVRDDLFETYQQELNIPSKVIDRGDEILNLAVEADQTRSRCYKTILAAITLIACRETGVPRVADDFANATIKNGDPLTRNDVHADYRRLKRELNIAVAPLDTETYLDYYLDELDAADDTREKAHNFLTIAQNNGMMNGPAPNTLAAGAVDAARRLTDDSIGQTEIADVSHVSANIVRQYYQQLTEQPAL